MIKLNQVAALFATAALAGGAFAQTVDNWRGTDGTVWKNGTNEYCWRDANWTPATGVQGCDGVPAPVAPAPVAAPAPAAAPDPNDPMAEAWPIISQFAAVTQSFGVDTAAYLDFKAGMDVTQFGESMTTDMVATSMGVRGMRAFTPSM